MYSAFESVRNARIFITSLQPRCYSKAMLFGIQPGDNDSPRIHRNSNLKIVTMEIKQASLVLSKGLLA